MLYVNSTYFRGTKKRFASKLQIYWGHPIFFLRKNANVLQANAKKIPGNDTLLLENANILWELFYDFFLWENKVFWGNFWILSQSMALPQEMLYSLTNHLRFFHWLPQKNFFWKTFAFSHKTIALPQVLWVNAKFLWKMHTFCERIQNCSMDRHHFVRKGFCHITFPPQWVNDDRI